MVVHVEVVEAVVDAVVVVDVDPVEGVVAAEGAVVK